MLPELGFIALLFALITSLLLAVIPHVGIIFRQAKLIAYSWHLGYLFALFSTLSLVCLAYGFAVDDFSLQYVAQHSNSQLPLFFKVAATWGGHEGSMLFWLFVLSLWTAIFALTSRQIDPILSARTLGILGLIALGLGIFILFFSNPFIRQFPVPPEGRDLNPMLQDIGLIFHPPLLYLGYVGFAVNFAMTVAGLLAQQFDAALMRWLRPWVLVSWLFLTLGILLGAVWAYYELGWGGWWFWDPVENASLMPWLVGLALLHSLNVSQQRGIFYYWTILFSLFAFALSLLGTFVVRSGVLTSVHGFAVDGERGFVLLLLFALLTLSALSLFAFKINLRQSAVRFSFISKESLILFANILLTVAVLSVFLGTFYPMFFSLMGWGSISVGAPYFNHIALPLIALMSLAMVLVLATKWQKIHRTLWLKRLLFLPLALISTYVMIEITRSQSAGIGFSLSAFALLSLAIWLLLATLWQNWRKISLPQLAMVLAHCGVAMSMIGAVMSSYFAAEKGVRLAPNQHQQLSGYDFHYQGFSNELGGNYTAEKAHFTLSKDGKFLTALYPEKRYYDVRTMNMSEVAIYSHWLADVYIVMGDKLGNGEFTFRLHYKPFVRWLWCGAILMALGALLAMLGLKQKRKGNA